MVTRLRDIRQAQATALSQTGFERTEAVRERRTIRRDIELERERSGVLN